MQKLIIDKINQNKIDQDDIDRVVQVLKSGFLSKPEGGPMIEKFQRLMKKAHNKKYAYGVTNGTSALHCAVSALELKPDEEVIVPALANIADCSVVIQEKGIPVFTDINPRTFNIDPDQIEQNITSKTRAIIVVHMYGQPVEIDKISQIAKKHNLVLIEDCAQAAGAKYKGRYVGSFGDISCFSLYQTKHIICGEGGVVLTSNEKFARIMTSIANNGIDKERLDEYDYDRLGYNYQLTEIQGALGIGQLNKLNANNAERVKNVKELKSLLSGTDLEFQHVLDETENSYFYLTALLPESLAAKRDEFLSIIKSLNAPIKKLYPLALTEITLLKDNFEQNCPIAQSITKRIFNFYVNPGMESKDLEFIANAVIKAYEQISSNH